MKLPKRWIATLLILPATLSFGQQGNRAFRDLQQEVEELRQKVHCYELERDILEEKIHKQEEALQKLQKDLSQSQNSKDEIWQNKISLFEKKISSLEQKNDTLLNDLKQLQTHANTTTSSLSMFKSKMGDLEENVNLSVTTLKSAVESLLKAMQKNTLQEVILDNKSVSKSYKVKSGDSLEKIAKAHGLKVEQLKKLNHLTKDRINVGQDLILEE
jgi:chromosome segregation ATPase